MGGGAERCCAGVSLQNRPYVSFRGRGVCCLFCVFVFLCFFLSSPICGGRECGRVWGRERAWLKGAGGGGSGNPEAAAGGAAGGAAGWSRPAQDETRRDETPL